MALAETVASQWLDEIAAPGASLPFLWLFPVDAHSEILRGVVAQKRARGISFDICISSGRMRLCARRSGEHFWRPANIVLA